MRNRQIVLSHEYFTKKYKIIFKINYSAIIFNIKAPYSGHLVHNSGQFKFKIRPKQ